MARTQHQRSLVGNAADEGQVKKAEEIEQYAKDRRANGFRYLLSTPVGRELAWSMLEECCVFVAVMAQSPYIFANAGRQDWGLQMWSEMIAADEDNCLLMQKEAIQRAKTLDRRTRPATSEN